LGKQRRVLLAPDPRLLLELLPDEMFRKIRQSRFCFVVDDDGTISDSNPMYIDWLARKLKRPLTLADYTRYDFSNIDKRALGMLIEGVFGKPRLHRHLPVIPGSVKALQEISKSGIPVVILTARPPTEGMRGATEAHKRDHRVPFDLMIFSSKKKDIIKALRKPGCRVIVVDDDPKVIAAAARLIGVTAIIFDAPYNERMRRENVIRAKEKDGRPAWDGVLKVVQKLIRNGHR
jgi:uncharacterized HAD superfamily protein